MNRVKHLWLVSSALAACGIGCSRGPSRIVPPAIDPDRAAAEAIRLYDANQNGSLSAAELAKCPGILAEFKSYDTDGNGEISNAEIAARIRDLRRHGVGLTRLNCDVTVNGRGLTGATVAFEPEPYLGGDIKAASGLTDDRGVAQMAVSTDDLPADQRDIRAIHYGTYKVRITHPTVKLPAKYNTETTLGYESRPGDPYASYALKIP